MIAVNSMPEPVESCWMKTELGALKMCELTTTGGVVVSVAHLGAVSSAADVPQ